MLNQPYIPEVKPTKSQRIVSYTVKFPLKITHPVYLYPYSKVSLLYNFMFQCCLISYYASFPFFTILLSISRRSCPFFGKPRLTECFRTRGGKKDSKNDSQEMEC